MSVVRIRIPFGKGKTPSALTKQEARWRPDFPMPSPRKYQDDILNTIYYALQKDDFDNIVVQAPTGIGKSAVAMTVQEQFQSAYLLTPTLGLTEQYKRDYPKKVVEVRGRNNFDCWLRPGTAKDAPCWTKRGGSCRHAVKDKGDPCPYYEQKWKAEDARITLSNPAYLFRVVQGNSGFEQRDFAIIDEAHQLENFIHDLLEVRLTERDWTAVFGPGKDFPMHYHAEDWIEDMDEFVTNARVVWNKVREEGDTKTADKLGAIIEKGETARDLLRLPTNVVVELDRNKWGRFLSLKPVRVRRYAADKLESIARKRIFLSATILDVETFLHSLGLEGQKTLYVNATQSPFPKENFDIFYAPCGSMAWGKRKHTIPKQVKAIAEIMKRHPNKRGVVLPHSHAVRKELVSGLEALGLGHRIVTHDGNASARSLALNSFFDSPNDDLVLISTYVGEGFDFKGKLAEWLVICKVPYLPMKDPAIEQRMKEDEHAWRREHEGTPACPYEAPTKYSNGLCGSYTCPAPCKKWYSLQTALKIVQNAGRIIRSETDKGSLYILDGSFNRFRQANAGLLPKWFRNNIKGCPNFIKRVL